MPGGAEILVILVILAFALPLGLLIGAVLLRAGISLYNKFAGGPESPSAVPEPTFLKAMGIVLVTAIVNWILGFGIGLAMGVGAFAANAEMNLMMTIAAQLASFAVSILVQAGILSLLLPTTFGRGLLVSLCYLLVCTIVGVVIAAVVFAVMLALGVGFGAFGR